MLFLSYSRNDLTIAQNIRESLEFLGVNVWMDIEKISTATSWSETVRAAVIAADQVAVVLSRASVTSRGVWAEYLLAEGHSKQVYVLRVDDSVVPTRIASYRGTVQVDLRSDPVTIDALRVALASLCARDSRTSHRPADSHRLVLSPPSEVLSFVRDMDQRNWICAPFAGLSLLSTWPVSRVLDAHVSGPSVSFGITLFIAAMLVWTYTRGHVLRREIGFGLAALGSGLPSLLFAIAGVSPLFGVFENPMALVPLLVTGKLDWTTAIAYCCYPVAALVTMSVVLLQAATQVGKRASSNGYIERWLPTTTPGPRDDDARLRQAEAFLAQVPAGEARARLIERVAVVYHPSDRSFGDGLVKGLGGARDVEVRGLLLGQLLEERTERWSSLADALVLVVSPPMMSSVARSIATMPLDVQTIPVLLQSTFVRAPLDHLQWIDARRDYSFVVERVIDALDGRDASPDGRELPRPSGFLTSAAAPSSVKARFALAFLAAAWPCALSIVVSASYRDTRLAFLCAAYGVVVAAMFFGCYARRRVGVAVVRLTCAISPVVFFVAYGDRYLELGSQLYGPTVGSILVIVVASAMAVGAQLPFSDWLRPRTLWSHRDLALWSPSPSSDPLVATAFLALSALFAWLALTV